MPHIGVAMERSLQEGSLKDAFVNLLARSAVAALGKRQSVGGIENGIKDAKTAFSSWDNCMQVNYCKWPVIAVIIIGGLIIFSIVWCIVRCACCGLSCCCQCCYCLKCCGECCGCCDPPRGKRHKYLDDPFIPPNHDQNQAYRSQAPMTPGLSPIPAAGPTFASSAPQYATFDDSNKKDADSLPAMPSWEGAKSQKVLVEDEPVEMEPLKKPESSLNNLNTNLSAGNVPRTTPSPVSPEGISPYGAPPGQGGPNGYMTAARVEADPYSPNGQGYDNQYDYNGYGQASQDNMNQGYGMAAAGAAGAMGRRTPHNGSYDNYNNNGYGRGGMDQGYPQSRTPRPYNDEYGRSGTPGSYGAPPSYRTAPSNNGYGNPSRMASPGPQAGYGYNNARRSPGPQVGFEYPSRSQNQTPNSYNRQYPPNPQRQYSNDSTRPLARPAPERQYSEASGPVSPIQNTGGFDFSSGYSRPNTAGGSQNQTANGGTAYPGYRSYRPQGGAQQQQQQDGWN
ncbi:hypothetical protein F4821DRAFT_221593 [Hypoxylon rubiginosum]|uniref:Uncharacterized protein n=1 Tax=Hypoxylon rubiginosum TaxID=110542 RepID=A0ACC0DMC4_9PEZI|nr:hypothetical protein F4821DRAFT_221593 [Hypoxylon rubiginosum]